jgi:hypothetical protein
MLTSFPLFDAPFLSSLLKEFRATMRHLLVELCDELEGPYRHASRSLRIPTGLVRAVGASLNREDFSNWKVVGWIEELNDLVYLLDVREQLRRESDPQGFAEAFYSSCESQFYEHGYLEELFPEGCPKAATNWPGRSFENYYFSSRVCHADGSRRLPNDHGRCHSISVLILNAPNCPIVFRMGCKAECCSHPLRSNGGCEREAATLIS